jgi:hypothetical protein
MYKKEVNEHSPLRILEQSIHGGLGTGKLGVVMARAGAGKTALLVQVGLDDLMRDKQVLHIALGQSLDHVLSWYDALFDDLSRIYKLDDRDTVRASIGKNRVIQAYGDHQLPPDRLERVLTMYATVLKLKPSAILIDGYDWEQPKARVEIEVRHFKSVAERLGAELWMTAQTHRSVTGAHPTKLTAPCEAFQELIDVALFLEPHGVECALRLLKDHEDATPPETHLLLDMNTMRIVEETPAGSASSLALPPSAFTLLSGGADGAEAEFGACSERWGIGEINFSFAGRTVVRKRGIVELTEAELKQGSVSPAYVEAQLHRRFPATPGFQRILQSIWHQVSTSGEVFVVGTILPDGTVKGGTGWAAELARHFHKPLHVFDQERKVWRSWTNQAWVDVPPPVITRARFTGSGTRLLSDEGREAIRNLFERTFGA